MSENLPTKSDNTVKLEKFLKSLIDAFAPNLPSALLEGADQLQRPLILTFTATPGNDEADIALNFGERIKTVEHEE